MSQGLLGTLLAFAAAQPDDNYDDRKVPLNDRIVISLGDENNSMTAHTDNTTLV
jgi:hypothetical protein